jgi:Zn-dependent peptidase ImmA (M78 family)
MARSGIGQEACPSIRALRHNGQVTVRVDVSPDVLLWAIERDHKRPEDLAESTPRLADWLGGADQPTFKQLEAFARSVHVPFGYLLLREPPRERLTIPDFRRRGGAQEAQPSADLLDTVFLCQQRQEWYREFAADAGLEPLPFVGSLSLGIGPTEAASRMREPLGLTLERRRHHRSWMEALRSTTDSAEAAGALVMVSSIVGSNTSRLLDPAEFGGFALVDDLAPVVFVNAADSKAAQFFTLVHELAHLWLGQSAITSTPFKPWADDERVERWCNAVAAELLVPIEDVRKNFDKTAPLAEEVQRLAERYRVSTLVVLRRALDIEVLTRDEYWAAVRAEADRVAGLQQPPTGGDFANLAPARASRRFTKAIITSALEGRTPYREAFRLLGFNRRSTFEDLRERLGIA